MLDRGEAALQDGDNIQAASLLLQSKLLAEQSGHPDLVYIADIDLGSVYFNLDEVGESMYYFQEALALVEQEEMDWEHRFSAMNGVAGSYFRLKDYKRAKEMLDQCLEAALNEQDSVAIVDFAMNLVRITTRQNNQQQALYYDSTMHAYLTPAYAHQVREYLSDVEMEMYYNQNRYDKARSLANYLLDSADFASGRSAALYTLCCMAQHDGDYAEALRLAREALRNSSFSRRRTLYDLMGNIYQQMGQQ